MGAITAHGIERCQDERPFHCRGGETYESGHRERIGLVLHAHGALKHFERQLQADPNSQAIEEYSYRSQRDRQSGHLLKDNYEPLFVAHPTLQLKRCGTLPHPS